MPAVSFKDIEEVSLILINFTTFSLFGMLISQWNYDVPVLFDQKADASKFDIFLQHYYNFNDISLYTVIFYGFVYGVGLLGSIVRVVKPHPDYQMFEYGTFILLFLFLCVFLTNVKTGIETCGHRRWGDVSEKQGLQVLAASNLILLVILLGIIFLQAGLWYTKWDYQKQLDQFFAEEQQEQAQTKAQTIPKEQLETIAEEETAQSNTKSAVKKRNNKKK
ncbi:hypothetical protein QEN19_000747 [Hanseniaspora menglaensis]